MDRPANNFPHRHGDPNQGWGWHKPTSALAGTSSLSDADWTSEDTEAASAAPSPSWAAGGSAGGAPTSAFAARCWRPRLASVGTTDSEMNNFILLGESYRKSRQKTMNKNDRKTLCCQGE